MARSSTRPGFPAHRPQSSPRCFCAMEGSKAERRNGIFSSAKTSNGSITGRLIESEGARTNTEAPVSFSAGCQYLDIALSFVAGASARKPAHNPFIQCHRLGAVDALTQRGGFEKLLAWAA